MKTSLPTDSDFIFNPTVDRADIPCQMVDACFTPVHAYNTTTSPVTTTRRARIGYLKELKHCN
jgi:hypothetical protein